MQSGSKKSENVALAEPVACRRTFAIISHPDAGKTTITEKLLLFGNAIQLAGTVKARKSDRHATSDWMTMEQQRGISVTTSVMQFPYRDRVVNLLDTPGHEDFSEDTYRTLTAVDSALMVIDGAKGVEPRTIKLMEVCRLRDTPIVTFVNKLDREIRDPVEVMDEIEDILQIQCAPMNWPVGMGRDFKGVYDFASDSIICYEGGHGHHIHDFRRVQGLQSDAAKDLLGGDHADFVDEVELVRGASHHYDQEDFLGATLSPVYFGTALGNFGVAEMLEGFVDHAPPPQPRAMDQRSVEPADEDFSGFVFKIQANMDPKHRDRIAFLRLCSGHFKRGMKLRHVRTDKQLALNNAVLFLARDRELAEEAWAGDIIGIPNHGNLHIGDALTEGETLRFKGIPSFAPEHLQAARPTDPMRAKHLGRALQQLAEEGAAAVFKPRVGSDCIVGVVGVLQFEVLADRIRTEYDIPVRFEPTSLITARWVETNNDILMKKFIRANEAALADDHRGDPVFLARNTWHLDRAGEDWPDINFLATKEQVA